jgi:hypothetical protein
MKKLIQLAIAGIFFTGIFSCSKEVSTPPKVTLEKPLTDYTYKVNVPIAVKATLYDKSGLGSVKLFVNSAWREEKVFANTEESLGGVESLDYSSTFVIDTLINYPKAAYWVKLTVTDVDGNAKTQQVLISLKP